MESYQTSKIFNILSFVVLVFALAILLLAKRNGWGSIWALYTLLLALLLRMASCYVKNKVLEKENAALKKDIKDLTRIFEDKIK